MAEAQKQADISAVISDLEKVVQEKPGNVMARHHLGLVYRKAGRVDEAITQLEKAIELDNQSMESMINLGAIFLIAAIPIALWSSISRRLPSPRKWLRRMSISVLSISTVMRSIRPLSAMQPPCRLIPSC